MASAPVPELPREAGYTANLSSPRPVVFTSRLVANIARFADKAERHGVVLRPHAKTHKSVDIAERQIEAGAAGLTVAKPGEARVFLEAGVKSLTVAYPLIHEPVIARLLLRARKAGAELKLMADSRTGVRVLQGAAAEVGITAKVFIKVDVGLHRCGLAPDDPELVELALLVSDSMDLEFAGILSHAGHAYGAGDFQGVCAVAEQEIRLMADARERLNNAGLSVPVVSVGSTPTVAACNDFTGITEIRPGNYVFFDLTQLRLGSCGPGDPALFVAADVVSVNKDYAIVNAGSKSLSSDAGAHGTGGDGFGLALPLDGGEPFKVVKLSEEHGFLERGGREVQVGQRLLIAPNHACPIPNLFDEMTAVDADGSIHSWPVSARGRVR